MSLVHYHDYDVEQDTGTSKQAVIGQSRLNQINRANRWTKFIQVLSFGRVGQYYIGYSRASWERRQELTLIFYTSLLKMLWSRFILILMVALVSARPKPELSLEEIEKGKLSCKTEQYT